MASSPTIPPALSSPIEPPLSRTPPNPPPPPPQSINPPPPPLQPRSTAFQHRINDEAFSPTPHAQSEAMSVGRGSVEPGAEHASVSPSPHPSPASPQATDCPSCSTSPTYRALLAQRQQDRHVYGESCTLSISCKHGRLLRCFSDVEDWGAAMRGRDDDGGEVFVVEVWDEEGEVQRLKGVGMWGEGRRFWVGAKERKGGIGGYVRVRRGGGEVSEGQGGGGESADESAELLDSPGPLSGRIVDDGNPQFLYRHPDHRYRLLSSEDVTPNNNNNDADYINHSKTSPSSLEDNEKATPTKPTSPKPPKAASLHPPLSVDKSTTAQPPDHTPQPLDLPTNLSARFRNYMLHGPPSAPYAISCVGDGEAVDFRGGMRGEEDGDDGKV